MSSIEGVRSAEKKVQAILDNLRETGARDPDNLQDQLRQATAEYTKAVRELVVAAQKESA
jgi:hypothetical protein